MTETQMPAAEATQDSFDERNSYEYAFHVLPTVAEGEVAGVFDSIKAHITKVGEIFDEETPERIDLIYPIVKSLDGKNRKYASAYFGWVRFKLDSDKVNELTEQLTGMQEVLRDMLLKLTAHEEANPYRFHENNKTQRMVETIDEDKMMDESKTEVEEDAEISEEALDESLDKITHEEEVK